MPTELELIHLLSHRIHRGKLPPLFDRIFHNLRILDYHPEELYGISLTPSLPPPEPSPDFISLSLTYKEDAEHHYKEDAERYKEDAAPGDKNRGQGRRVEGLGRRPEPAVAAKEGRLLRREPAVGCRRTGSWPPPPLPPWVIFFYFSDF